MKKRNRSEGPILSIEQWTRPKRAHSLIRPHIPENCRRTSPAPT